MPIFPYNNRKGILSPMSTGGRKVVDNRQNFVNVVRERTFKAGPETDDHIGFVGRSRGTVPIYWPFY